MNRPLLSRLALPGAAWAGILAIELCNWHQGAVKGAALLFVLCVTVALMRAARHGASLATKSWNRPLVAVCGVLFALQIVFLCLQLRHPHLIDGATTTLAAGRALLAGINPYSTPLDAEALRITGDAAFAGYKYLPAMALVYMPLGALFDARGVLLTNLGLELATLWLIYRLGCRIGTRGAALLAALFYLSLPIAMRQVFGKGATDLVAVVPMLAALLAQEKHPGLAGFCAGLSISAKLLPGALLVPCALPPRGRRGAYFLGLLAGVAPALVFLALSPAALYDNIVLFNAMRPADSTSWLADAPAGTAAAMSAVFGLSFTALSIATWRQSPSLVSRCGLLGAAAILAILSGPAAHHNYHLWWIPLLSVLVGAAITAEIPRRAPRELDASEPLRAGSRA